MMTNPRLLAFAEALCCCLLWYILIFHIFPLTWYIFFFYYLCKLSEQLVYRIKYGATPFDSIDSLWLRDNPTNRIIINAILIVEGDIDLETFKKMLSQKLRLDSENADNPYIKTKQRILRGFLHDYWVDNPNFSIADHVSLWPKLIPSKKDLKGVVSQLCTREFDITRSPWEYVLISFIDDDKIFKTALLVRLHHCIADGISLGHFLINELADSTVETVPLRKFSERNRLLMNLKGIFWGPYFIANMLTMPRDESILHGKPMSGTKAVSWSEEIDFEIVKDIKNRSLSTVNDVLVSTLAATLTEFFNKNGVILQDDIKVSIPIDLRSNMGNAAIKFKNKLTVVPFQLPTSLPHPFLQLNETKSRTNELKRSGEPFFLGIALEICTRIVPGFILDPLNRFLCQKTTAVLSNVPGPQNDITICDRPMVALIFWAPQRDNIGISFSFATHANKLFFGVQSDVEILQNPDEITNAFKGRLIELQKCIEEENANMIVKMA